MISLLKVNSDSTLSSKGFIHDYEGFTFNKVLNDVGSFSFRLAYEKGLEAIVSPDTVVYVDSRISGVIESVSIDVSQGFIYVAGKSLECLLERFPANYLDTNYGQAIPGEIRMSYGSGYEGSTELHNPYGFVKATFDKCGFDCDLNWSRVDSTLSDTFYTYGQSLLWLLQTWCAMEGNAYFSLDVVGNRFCLTFTGDFSDVKYISNEREILENVVYTTTSQDVVNRVNIYFTPGKTWYRGVTAYPSGHPADFSTGQQLGFYTKAYNAKNEVEPIPDSTESESYTIQNLQAAFAKEVPIRMSTDYKVFYECVLYNADVHIGQKCLIEDTRFNISTYKYVNSIDYVITVDTITPIVSFTDRIGG